MSACVTFSFNRFSCWGYGGQTYNIVLEAYLKQLDLIPNLGLCDASVRNDIAEQADLSSSVPAGVRDEECRHTMRRREYWAGEIGIWASEV